MTRKPFAWTKLTPAQIDLMERIAAADNALVLPHESFPPTENFWLGASCASQTEDNVGA